MIEPVNDNIPVSRAEKLKMGYVAAAMVGVMMLLGKFSDRIRNNDSIER